MYLGKWKSILATFFLIVVVVAFIGWQMVTDFVDQHEVGYKYDRLTGEITVLERTGYFFTWPVIVNIGTIDARPIQVCIAGKVNRVRKRVLNCKLVRFNKEGLKTFIEWHSRDYGDLDEILKAYAYDGRKKGYPFLEVLAEINSDGSTKLTNTKSTKPAETATKPGG